MRYHSEPPLIVSKFKHGTIYECNHPVYNKCTLYLFEGKGLAVIQQRFNPETKSTYWSELDDWIVNEIFMQPGFVDYFDKRADKPKNKLYPTVTVRQIMWALRMKPLPKHRWETVFDRKSI